MEHARAILAEKRQPIHPQDKRALGQMHANPTSHLISNFLINRPRQGHVKLKLIEHMRVAMGQQQFFLALSQTWGAAALKFFWRGCGAQLVRRQHHILAKFAHLIMMVGQGEGKKTMHIGELQSRMETFMSLRDLAHHRDHVVTTFALRQPHGRAQGAMKTVFSGSGGQQIPILPCQAHGGLKLLGMNTVPAQPTACQQKKRILGGWQGINRKSFEHIFTIFGYRNIHA